MHPDTFSASPLITPERISADHREAFAQKPECIYAAEHIGDEMLTVIRNHNNGGYKFSRLSAALLYELARVGFYPASNSNAADFNPKEYLKLCPRGAYQDTVVFLRIVTGAGRGEGVQPGWLAGDQNPEHAIFGENPTAKRDARPLAMANAERLAREGVASGALPREFRVARYMANLWNLLAAVDEAMGRAAHGS